MKRICYECEYCDMENSTPGYSDWTPGTDFEFYCEMSHWRLDTRNDGMNELSFYLEKANDCPDFTPRFTGVRRD